MTETPAHILKGRNPWPSRLLDHGNCCSNGGGSFIIAAPARDIICKPLSPSALAKLAEDDRARELDQFFTTPAVAKLLYRHFQLHFDPAQYQMVEPSAGRRAFLDLLPHGSFGCDIQALAPGILSTDFLALDMVCGRSIAFIGNPPFGKAARLARRFFNYAAPHADVIAFILPLTFRKASVINGLNSAFHLVCDKPVPADAFLFKAASRDVPTTFQIWERREEDRPRLPDATTHPDFRFVKASERPDFAIQRIGVQAGRVHRDFELSEKAHYFIKGRVKRAMRQLRPEFTKAAMNTVGNPSLAKCEIVALYHAKITSTPPALLMAPDCPVGLGAPDNLPKPDDEPIPLGG